MREPGGNTRGGGVFYCVLCVCVCVLGRCEFKRVLLRGQCVCVCKSKEREREERG